MSNETYTQKTMVAYRGLTKTRIAIMCKLRQAVIDRYLNTVAKEDSLLVAQFDVLIGKYDDVINTERLAYALFCDRTKQETPNES